MRIFFIPNLDDEPSPSVYDRLQEFTHFDFGETYTPR